MTLTDNALEALQEMNLPEGSFLRISIIPGGCSGQTYSATLDDELFITDLVLYKKGSVRVVSDPDSVEFLSGLEIDYSDDLIRSGFQFANPNASGCCGCGASFEG
jgi:iron-sulfur cluster assembly protein